MTLPSAGLRPGERCCAAVGGSHRCTEGSGQAYAFLGLRRLVTEVIRLFPIESVYDAADRVNGTSTFGITPTQTPSYARDPLGRVVSRPARKFR